MINQLKTKKIPNITLIIKQDPIITWMTNQDLSITLVTNQESIRLEYKTND